jgi:hypothetical protein
MVILEKYALFLKNVKEYNHYTKFPLFFTVMEKAINH